MNHLLIADEISEQGRKLLSESLQVDYRPDIEAADLRSVIGNYEALLVRSRTKVTADIIRAGKKLKVIGRAGVGVDNIDVNVATECGIVVLNSPEGNTASAAEHTIAMMMSLARRIPAADNSVRKGLWERNKFVGTEVFNKTLGVIGMGKVGGRVVQTALTLGMKVMVYDPFITSERALELKVHKCSLDELWAKADFISIHAPLTKETKGLINAGAIAKMKPGVKILNCARGGIVNEADLAQAIKSGQVSGSAIDVFENEPPENSPLLELGDKVVLTPHLGASTHEAQFNVAIDLAEQIRDYLQTGIARSPVNLPAMEPEAVIELGKYIWLAEAMGSIACELSGGQAEALEVIAHGELAQKEISPLVVAALRGVLARSVNGVTYVNAHLVAKNKGIQVRTSKDEQIDQFKEELTIIVSAANEKTTLTGTILTNQQPLITRINALPISLYPENKMLFTSHYDKPGVVAMVAGILADHDINISNMSLARKALRENSCMVMGVDDSISVSILEKLVKLPNVYKANFISLESLAQVPC